ncbi:MAG: class I SAM-dependent DNA methyltransferase [Ignavibacteria bacterium]|nr:class I SAM-dependent DNA methyltransferase [Ignavibacteria bacterium]
MLALSDIRSRATAFAERWKDEVSEDAEAKTFWHEFFAVFGVDRKRVASFEKQVTKTGKNQGFIDLFWSGVCIVEHKSAGKDLDKALSQAVDYFSGLKDHELPRYVIVSDFQRIRLYDLIDDTNVEIRLEELPQRIELFGFISGYVPRKFRDEDPVNVKAAELMGRLHDAIKATGYDGHQLEVFLTRLLFCLFGDDTGIFNRDSFVSFLETKTREDGMDVGPQLSFLFQLLNTPQEKRPKNLDEELQAFPYVNGSLFAETIPTPNFDREMRERLLECANFDWTFVSPAVFGAMFQGGMNAAERRNLGAHYTSEKNILKVVSGLFLDEIEEELTRARSSEHRLRALHDRISRMRFLDPACGCGNFLIVTYKELRRTEIEILLQLEALGKLSGKGQQVSDVSALSRLSVHSMFGIEIEEFPARIAEVALWLIDHIMNVDLARAFGGYFVRLPLTNGPTIRNTDALEIDWRTKFVDTELDAEWYILGNPPFSGSTTMTARQKEQMRRHFGGIGMLDYVTAWFILAARCAEGTNIRIAFVATNSITQGEQVGVLWRILSHQYSMTISFAHKTFRWSNEARGQASVHVVIIGFSSLTPTSRFLYEYEDVDSEPIRLRANSISGFLADGPMTLIFARPLPLSPVSEMSAGNKPTDDGNFFLTESERIELLAIDTRAGKYIKKAVGASEFINRTSRYCLWLVDANPSDLRSIVPIFTRVTRVREFRLKSTKVATQRKASTPMIFDEVRQPASNYLLVPRHSAEVREYIPMGFMTDDTIVLDSCLVVPDATMYEFGVMTSSFHMAWVRLTCGRIKSDYRYSASIVYNNYPWPDVTEEQRKKVEELAQKVLDARANHPTSSLADLYHPTTMPPDLRKAHEALDKAVDACYRKEAFKSERERVEYLFGLYRKLTEGFGAEEKRAKKKRP